jgi:N-acetylglutamate synthase-like GNAT family acetyltransferase
MEIDYLADHLELVPILAEWHHAEWTEFTLETTAVELRTHTGRRQIPTTFVAIEDGRVIGSTSLLVADLVGWEHLTPWVASVFVAPAYRRRGIARALMERAVHEARLMGIPSVYLFTASKEAYYARLGWSPFERALYRAKEIVIMRRILGTDNEQALPTEEREILASLDPLVTSLPVRRHLAHVVERVTQRLKQDTASAMAWESLPLTIYGNSLPPVIRSSWIFVLRAGATTGAERHPNSHQRMMSLRGSGDIQTGGESCWKSHLLVSDNGAELLDRWASIPPNEWHQAVVPSQDWVVVSFHTAAPEELIEERPDAKNANLTRQRHYIGS